MRHNDARKWLHAVLDLLPVILIPVFMIFSHRHDVASTTSYTEEVPVYYETNEVNDISDIALEHIYAWNDNYTPSYLPANNLNLLEIENNYLLDSYIENREEVTNIYIQLSSYDGRVMLIWLRDNSWENLNLNQRYLNFVVKAYGTNFNSISYCLSSISESSVLLVKEYQQVVTTFDKDIMGAFIDNFNFTINKYFNMGNIFNMNNVYQWFETNIFGGSAPTVIYSVWNIVLYEFVMDLLFLLYGLFMWFIDMCKKLMEKPLNSIK